MTAEAFQIHDEEAERSLIGAVLLHGDPRVFDRCDVSPADFFGLREREAWEAIGRLCARKARIDPLLVHDETPMATVDLPFLSACLAIVPTADNAEHYAAIVKRHALTRRVRLALHEHSRSELEGDELVAAVLESVTKFGTSRKDAARPMSELARCEFERLHKLAVRKEAGETFRTGLPTGIPDLDFLLGGGLQEGIVTLIGARPAIGKSSLARTMADECASSGFGTHVFTMEDQADVYAQRTFADRARLDLHKLRTVEFNRGDLDRMTFEGNKLKDMKNWLVDDTPRLSAAEIALRVRRHKAELKTRLVVVDYVQIMAEPEVAKRGLREEVTASAKGLQALAKDEGVSVLLLSQLNRESEKEDREPTMRDLREAGALEECAKAIILLHRKRDSSDAVALVPKQTNGPSGSRVSLYFEKHTATYRPAARQERYA